MKKSKELQRAHDAWDKSWVEPISAALEDLDSLAEFLDPKNSLGIDVKQLRQLSRQFERVISAAWEISFTLERFDLRIHYAQEDNKDN